LKTSTRTKRIGKTACTSNNRRNDGETTTPKDQRLRTRSPEPQRALSKNESWVLARQVDCVRPTCGKLEDPQANNQSLAVLDCTCERWSISSRIPPKLSMQSHRQGVPAFEPYPDQSLPTLSATMVVRYFFGLSGLLVRSIRDLLSLQRARHLPVHLRKHPHNHYGFSAGIPAPDTACMVCITGKPA
jgi:hypothetical protein